MKASKKLFFFYSEAQQQSISMSIEEGNFMIIKEVHEGSRCLWNLTIFKLLCYFRKRLRVGKSSRFRWCLWENFAVAWKVFSINLESLWHGSLFPFHNNTTQSANTIFWEKKKLNETNFFLRRFKENFPSTWPLSSSCHQSSQAENYGTFIFLYDLQREKREINGFIKSKFQTHNIMCNRKCCCHHRRLRRRF